MLCVASEDNDYKKSIRLVCLTEHLLFARPCAGERVSSSGSDMVPRVLRLGWRQTVLTQNDQCGKTEAEGPIGE